MTTKYTAKQRRERRIIYEARIGLCIIFEVKEEAKMMILLLSPVHVQIKAVLFCEM
jgi:hypothetical protein